MSTKQTKLVDAIRGIPEGRTWSARSPREFVHCARRDGQYVVECGWVVPEGHDDDPGSSTYHPFGARGPVAWVGRQAPSTTDPERATRLYLEYQTAVQTRRGNTLAGEVIGSVFR